MTEHKQLWNGVLHEIELSTSKASFSTWFKNTSIVKQDGGVVSVGVPNEFVRDWLSNKYHKIILRSLRNISSEIHNVEYAVVRKGLEKEIAGIQKIIPGHNELPLNDLYIDKRDNLNPRYTFDVFVLGAFNDLAHAATQAVIKSPGTAYNPLFIHGGTGLGKTHLLQAIGNHLKQERKVRSIHYVTSEKFTTDYVLSVKTNKVDDFKEKYRKYDVLIMDDIQFLSKKDKTQEELFHLFNTLYENNRQIIFSSDKHPNLIPELEDRLKSRFAQGMVVEIFEPEYESRFAILKDKAGLRNFFPPDEILDYLASSVKGNIRELEGILNSLICQTELRNKQPSINEVKFLIKNNLKQKRTTSVKDLVKIVAGFYDIDEESIYKKTRRKEVVKPRQIIMYILREDFNISYPTIGQKLGGRDHTTVIHSCEKIRSYLKEDTSLLQDIDQIRSMI